MQTIKHESPTDEDIERVNQSLDFDKINTKEDYDRELAKFMKRKPTQKQLNAFWSGENSQTQLKKFKFFREAGGKDLGLDAQKTHRIILNDVNEYLEKGARRSDLTGFDMPKSYGYFRIGERRLKRKIDRDKSVIVRLKPSYSYTREFKPGIKTVITVNRKILWRVYVYDKMGKRLGLKKSL